MNALLFAPHADDETLFAAFLAQKYMPHIVIVYNEGKNREEEMRRATTTLGCEASQWVLKKGSGTQLIRNRMRALKKGHNYDLVISPAWEIGGHEEHNLVGKVAKEVFFDIESVRYLTYAPRGQRSKYGIEVSPEHPRWIANKLTALGCYESQIRAHKAWFFDLLDLREWILPAWSS